MHIDLNLPALTARIESLRRDVSGRLIIGIAGPPGSGKTTVAENLVAHLNSQGGYGRAVHVPMDGFHLANVQLEQQGLLQVKGAPETFDVLGYANLLNRLCREQDQVVYAPEFDRRLEEPVAGAIAIATDHHIVITEGNYLLVNEPGWLDARAACAEVWFLNVPREVAEARLMERHILFGKPRARAAEWVRGVDAGNARLVAATRSGADLTIDVRG